MYAGKAGWTAFYLTLRQNILLYLYTGACQFQHLSLLLLKTKIVFDRKEKAKVGVMRKTILFKLDILCLVQKPSRKERKKEKYIENDCKC